MRSIATVLTMALLAFAGLQTRESALEQNVVLSCSAEEAAGGDCMSIGPLGGVKPSGVRFWAATFVDHCVELPSSLGGAMIARTRRLAL